MLPAIRVSVYFVMLYCFYIVTSVFTAGYAWFNEMLPNGRYGYYQRGVIEIIFFMSLIYFMMFMWIIKRGMSKYRRAHDIIGRYGLHLGLLLLLVLLTAVAFFLDGMNVPMWMFSYSIHELFMSGTGGVVFDLAGLIAVMLTIVGVILAISNKWRSPEKRIPVMSRALRLYLLAIVMASSVTISGAMIDNYVHRRGHGPRYEGYTYYVHYLFDYNILGKRDFVSIPRGCC